MYGLGYGLARMAEGASGGALKGKLTQMGLEEREKTRQSETDYRTATLAQGERGLDLREQGLAQQADVEQKKLDAQKALGLDDAGMKMYSEGVKIGLGMLGQGHSDAARDFMNRLFVQFKQPQQIDKLEETQDDEWKATTSDGGVWLFNGKTGDVKQVQEPGQKASSPSEQITGLKLTAWTAYFKGTATPEQKRMIKVDTDPLLAQLVGQVNDDQRYWDLPYEQKALKAMEMAEMMRESNSASAFKKMIPQYNPEETKVLDRETAMKILKEAKGNTVKAREIARQRGYSF